MHAQIFFARMAASRRAGCVDDGVGSFELARFLRVYCLPSSCGANGCIAQLSPEHMGAPVASVGGAIAMVVSTVVAVFVSSRVCLDWYLLHGTILQLPSSPSPIPRPCKEEKDSTQPFPSAVRNTKPLRRGAPHSAAHGRGNTSPEASGPAVDAAATARVPLRHGRPLL